MQVSNDINAAGVNQGIQRTTETLKSTLQNFADQLLTAIAGLGDGSKVEAASMREIQTSTDNIASVFGQLVASLQSQNFAAKSESKDAQGHLPTAISTPSPVGMSQPVELAQRLVSTVAPGERGAGLPANYMKSPLYEEWLAKEPVMGSNVQEYGKALTAWQESNPFYVNPKNYRTFDEYLGAVSASTASGNSAAERDPARLQSYLTSYYQTAAGANPWGSALGKVPSEEIATWPDEVQALYRQTVSAEQSRAAYQI